MLPQWRKKRTFRHTVFLHYSALSLLVFKARLSQSAESQSFSILSLLSRIFIIKAPGTLFLSFSCTRFVFFSFQAPDTLKREGERCNNQRMLYRTEKQPMNFFFLGKVQEIHYINFDSPTEFKRLARSLASSWRPGSENFAVIFPTLNDCP